MLKRRFFVIFFLNYFLVISSTQKAIEWMEPDNLIEFNSTSGNLTYNSESQENSWIINVNDEPGFGIQIRIDGLSVNSSADEFLLLAGGRKADENSVIVQILTGEFEIPLYYRMPNTLSFYLKISSEKGSFNLTYESYGEAFTTYAPPTVNPNPPSTPETTYQILLKGKSYTDILNDTYPLSMVMLEIAKLYCEDNNITFEVKPVKDTVHFDSILPCAPDWPESEICAAVTHSIFVSGTAVRFNRIIMDYELTRIHLEDMWKNYGAKELGDIGLSVYEEPSTGDTILWWLLLIGICLVVALVSLIVFWKFEQVFTKSKREIQQPDTFEGVEIRQKNKHRLSEYQNVPNFMTEPDIVLKYSKGSQRDKKPAPRPPVPKPLELSNVKNIDNLTPQQQSPLSPVTPAGNYSAGLYFNYNRAFVEEDEEIEI